MDILVGYIQRQGRQKKKAKDYLTRAYNLVKSIGVEGAAEEVLFYIQELEKKR
jgi:hypothetical protein